ncbi:dual specificity protein phosphatase family protein [Halohasta salina]|uniref:dual specificity protein phosphatase family protein n=1 Tax=Halohasta salina TaxID=2961621 RepID=UPI0020A4AF63|nr:dual specificity protein phosphatase [Halohasta salina]
MDRVAESLFVGTIEDAGTGPLLENHGTETVVSLTHSPPDTGFPESVSVKQVPLTDGPQNDRAQFNEAVDVLVSALESGETVLVHCSRGASRSPSVAATALAITQDIGIKEAFEQVAEHREACDPHEALVRQAVAVYQEW